MTYKVKSLSDEGLGEKSAGVDVITTDSINAQSAALPSQPAARFYHPELDVLRFCAFFLVFEAHASFDLGASALTHHVILSDLCIGFHNAGFSGVCLFFVLSSYLITELLLKEHEATGRIRLRDFYLRRVLRIWPLYFFFLLLVRPLAAHFIPGERFSGTYLAAYLLLVGNWQCYYHDWPASIAAPLWSISIEEQFYLGWPLLVSRFRRSIPAIALTMLVVANLSRIVLSYLPSHGPNMWANTFTRLDPFALGALLAWCLQGREVRLDAIGRSMLGALGLLLLTVIGRFGDHVGSQGLFFYPLEALACTVLLLAVLRPVNSWKPGLVGKTLIYLGRISYGLYVYHLLFLTLTERTHARPLVQEGIALLLTVATASASYGALERPFLLLKGRFTHVRSRPD